jgi:hypothetical protein
MSSAPPAGALGSLDGPTAPISHAPTPVNPAYGELELGSPVVPDLVFAPRASAAPSRAPAVSASAPPVDITEPKLPSFAPPPVRVPSKKPSAAPPVADSFDDMDMMSNDYGTIDLAGPTGVDLQAPPPSHVLEPPPAPLASSKGITLLLSEDGGSEAARRLGDYGDAPAEWWKTPMYAYRVKTRQAELRRVLSDRRAELQKAQDATDIALAILGERGRKYVAGNEAYAKLNATVAAAESALNDRDSALAAATDAHRKQLAEIDARIIDGEADVNGAKAEEKSYNDVFTRADEIRQRADVKVKRVDIELRAAVTRATPAGVPAGGAMSDEVRMAVEARTAERDARMAELQQTLPAVADATQRLSAARRRTVDFEQKVRAAKNERAALEATFAKRGATQGAEVESAQKGVRTALAALGRAAAGDHSVFGPEWDGARRELALLDKATAGRDDQVMLHVMALDAYDRPKVKTGLVLVLSAIAFVMLLALLPLAFRAAAPAVQTPTTIPMP